MPSGFASVSQNNGITLVYSKQAFSAASIAITFIAYLPYTIAIIRGKIKPHVFSWIIWGITTFVVFFAQLADNGGAGAWPTGLAGIISLIIAVIAYLKRGDVEISKTDWAFFIAALASLPLWYFTANPLWAVVILTLIDVLGFGPTIRKVYHEPHSESLTFYTLYAIRGFVSIPALENYSVTTLFNPAVVSAACLLFVAMALVRRRALTV